VDSTGMPHVAGGAGLISTFSPGAAPDQTTAPWIFGVVNSAGGALAGRLAPGELFSIYGLHLGPATPVSASFDASGFLPVTLGGVAVKVNGIAAPLLYVSGTQINAVAPVELTAGSEAGLQVSLNDVSLPEFRTIVDRAAPQVFRNPDGSAVAINQDGTVNSADNPAPDGSFVSIWATGTGYFPGSDGQMATGADSFCAVAGLCEIFETYNGTPVDVSYIGAAPFTVNGVVQINFQVAPGSGLYYFNVDGVASDMFELYGKP
jgi:uncharacterized protein (TIGR03437 family)